MAFYENTLVAKQDLSDKDLKALIEKYSELINNSSGKVIKIEEWGLLNLSKKIKKYKKGFLFIINLKVLTKLWKKLKIKLKLTVR